MLNEDHWIIILDRREHQPVGIGRVRRHDDFQASGMREPAFQEIRMLAAGAHAGAGHAADHQRHMGLAAGHEAQFGGVIDDHVHRTVVKFISMISATGRIPTMAAPMAAPMMACS